MESDMELWPAHRPIQLIKLSRQVTGLVLILLSQLLWLQTDDLELNR